MFLGMLSFFFSSRGRQTIFAISDWSSDVCSSDLAPGAYAAQPAGIGGASAEAAWWRQFGDPALDALITEALAANLDARLAVARLDEARALAGVSRAGQLPGGGVDASYQRRRIAHAALSGGQPSAGDALRPGAEARKSLVEGTSVSGRLDRRGG